MTCPAITRLRAQQQLANLMELLRGHPDPERVTPLIELCGHLDRAIGSFHMEAIRFRMFTLGRKMHELETELPSQARTLYDAVRGSLEAAGFHTRSVAG
jgi:hypothetical protein